MEQKVKKEAKSWIMEFFLPILIVLLLNLFVVRLVVVSGDSMYPTLHDHDFLIVRMLGYKPQMGDIVVVHTDPDGDLGGEQIVKRVIATEGQTVFVDYGNNRVTVDGTILKEDYINMDGEDPMQDGIYENTVYVVPKGCVFVLGDKRNHSADSRDSAVGMIEESDVFGGLMLRITVGR